MKKILGAFLGLFLLATPALGVTFDTWDNDIVVTTGPAGTFVTLSNSNLTAQGNSTNYTTVQTKEGKKSGKWYVEITKVAGGGNTDGCGIYNSWGHNAGSGNNYYGASGTNLPSNDQGWEYFGNGAGLFNHGASQTIVNMPSYTNADVIGIAIDLDNKRLWFRKNTGSWGGTSGTPDPATNTGGFDISNMLTGNARVYVVCDMQGTGTNSKWTANFGGSAFTGSVPSGFTSGWTNTTSGTYFGSFAMSRGNSDTLSGIGGGLQNKKIVSVYTPSITGSITSVVLVFSGTAGTVSDLKGVIYDDSGTAGAPGALLGVSTNTVTSGGYGEYTFTFSPITISNGHSYWIGFTTDAVTSTTVNMGYMPQIGSGTNYSANSANTYASPSNPFGSVTQSGSARLQAIINVAPPAASKGAFTLTGVGQ